MKHRVIEKCINAAKAGEMDEIKTEGRPLNSWLRTSSRQLAT